MKLGVLCWDREMGPKTFFQSQKGTVWNILVCCGVGHKRQPGMQVKNERSLYLDQSRDEDELRVRSKNNVDGCVDIVPYVRNRHHHQIPRLLCPMGNRLIWGNYLQEHENGTGSFFQFGICGNWLAQWRGGSDFHTSCNNRNDGKRRKMWWKSSHA